MNGRPVCMASVETEGQDIAGQGTSVCVCVCGLGGEVQSRGTILPPAMTYTPTPPHPYPQGELEDLPRALQPPSSPHSYTHTHTTNTPHQVWFAVTGECVWRVSGGEVEPNCFSSCSSEVPLGASPCSIHRFPTQALHSLVAGRA